MRLSVRRCWRLLAIAAGLRLVSMWLLPLTDTTEPRYAEVARLMAVGGDWITPWFEAGVPFWGKPPLAFWSQALAFRLWGVNELAARLPSLLATAATLALIFALARALFDARTARWAVVIYATSLLPFVAAGAVLTDPFLVLGTTLSLTSFAMAARQAPPRLWGHGFFVGIAIGLLAKGPLAAVLVIGPITTWALWHRHGWQLLRALPWRSGLLLTAALCLPWYIAAELKTPGFLRYFLLGEHLLRFIDPGWTGDRYGNAHHEPYGMIWLHWLAAAFPWGLVALIALLRQLTAGGGKQPLLAPLVDFWKSYLLGWSLFTPLFFTLAGNILWTYVLPALPAFSILLADHLARRRDPGASRRWLAVALLVPVVALILTVVVTEQPQRLKSEKGLIDHANRIGNHQLIYVENRPFSARFYSRGTAELVKLAQLQKADRFDTVLLAVPKHKLAAAEARLGVALDPLFVGQRYVLVSPSASPTDLATERTISPHASK